MALGSSAAETAPIWLPFLINYGVIIASITLLALAAHWRLRFFREWYAQPINKFWLVWITLVVGSGAMVSPRPAARACGA